MRIRKGDFMKKSIIIVAAVLLVSLAAIICITKFKNKDVINNETKQSDVSKELADNKENVNNETSEDDKEDESKTDIKEQDSNSTDVKLDEDNSVGTSNSNSANNAQNSNNNSTSPSGTTNTPSTETENKGENPKSCTPKKFDVSFVRADFNSISKCTEMGDKYKAIGYGYFCDDYEDDCGDTYYMLTLYERNTGVELDYHNVELPN